jgi:hypothetical protein
MREGTISLEYSSWFTRILAGLNLPRAYFRSPSRGTYRYTVLAAGLRKQAFRCDACETVVFRGHGRVYPW